MSKLRLAPCPQCGVSIVVDAANAPVTEHVDSPICRAVAAERRQAKKERTEP